MWSALNRRKALLAVVGQEKGKLGSVEQLKNNYDSIFEVDYNRI